MAEHERDAVVSDDAVVHLPEVANSVAIRVLGLADQAMNLPLSEIWPTFHRIMPNFSSLMS